MNYTKGEWKAVKNHVGSYTIQTENTRIGEVDRHSNAHLITAAPEMYETGLQLLEVICELCRRLNPQHENCQSCEEIEGYRRAFTKAEGK